MEQNKIWDYFQNEGVDSFDGSYKRLGFLLKQCPEGSKVLNIGVGNAIFEQMALAKDIDIYTVDPNENAIAKLQKQIGLNKAKVGYSQQIPFENDLFDVVVMSEVLEHLDNVVLTSTISDVHRVLKQGGRFIGTVPYKENLLDQLAICPTCGEQFHRWGHIQSFDEKGLEKLLKQKFSLITLQVKLFINWKRLNFKGKVVSLLNYLVYVCGLKESGLNLFFEVKKV